MGNFCCENRNIDEGNFKSDKPKLNSSPIKQEEKNSNENNKIINVETKFNQNDKNTLPYLLENNQNQNQTNNIDNFDNIIPQNNSNISSLKQTNIKIPDDIINTAKKLKLIILQSKYLREGKEYIINAGGLLGSKRNAKDGITYFGDATVSLLNNIYHIVYLVKSY